MGSFTVYRTHFRKRRKDEVLKAIFSLEIEIWKETNLYDTEQSEFYRVLYYNFKDKLLSILNDKGSISLREIRGIMNEILEKNIDNLYGYSDTITIEKDYILSLVEACIYLSDDDFEKGYIKEIAKRLNVDLSHI